MGGALNVRCVPYFKPNKFAIYNITDRKIHFLLGVDSYVFRHQDAIFREFNKKNDGKSNNTYKMCKSFAHTKIIPTKKIYYDFIEFSN